MATSILQKKVSLLGDFSTGKTSLVRRFVYNLFDEKYISTIGVNISRKIVELSDFQQIRLLIWDMSGNERFDGARVDYLRGTSGALLVCDLARQDTLEKMAYFKNRLFEICSPIPVILIGNKSDLVKNDCETIRQLKEMADQNDVSYRITSAKTGEGVDETFTILAKNLIDHHGK